MLRLHRLRVRDVGRLADTTVDLDGQLVGITARNGAGKSTLMESIHYAVTGNATRLGGQKAVRAWATDPRPAVDLEFFPGCGVVGSAVLSRTLPVGKRPGTRKLAWDASVVTSDADIADKVREWTGVETKVLSDFVFVEQGRLSDVVNARPSERAEVLQRLFGVARAAAGFAAAQRVLAAMPSPPDPAALSAVRARAASNLAALRSAESDLALLEAQSSALGDPVPDAAAVDAYERRLRQSAARVKAEAEAAAARDHASRLWEELTSLQSTLDPPEVVEAAGKLLAAWDRYKNWAGRRAQVMDDRRRSEARLDTPAVPVPPAVCRSAELEDLAGRASALTALSVGAPGDPCPVCGGALGPGFDPRSAAEGLKRLRLLEAEHRREVSAWTLEYNRAAEDAKERSRAEVCFIEANRTLTALDANPAVNPIVGEAELRQTISDDREKREKIRLVTGSFELASAVRDDLARNLGPVEQSADPVPTEEEYLSAVRRRVDRRRIDLDLSAARARTEALRQTATGDEETLRRLEAAEKTSGRLAAWRLRVEKLQSVLHRDAAPATAATACLQDLEGDINRRLGHLNANFRLKVKSDGDLVIDYADGTKTRKLSPDRLSWAERSILALGWRIAVQDRYAPGVGLLCLDEPTHGLDGDRLDAFRSALEAWRPHGAARQFVVVTHDRRLLGVFDRVVDLGG